MIRENDGALRAFLYNPFSAFDDGWSKAGDGGLFGHKTPLPRNPADPHGSSVIH